jgi:hypothetical protein
VPRDLFSGAEMMTPPRCQSQKKPRHKSVHWTKSYLLPMPHESVRRLSLAAHLALVGCVTDEGSQHFLNEIIRTTYLSFIMLRQGYGSASVEIFRTAESLLDAAVFAGGQTGIWRLNRETAEIIEWILRIFDEQIATVSTKSYWEANSALARLIGKTHIVSPISVCP